MNRYLYMYEDKYGQLAEYETAARSREEADDNARRECPDAIDAGIEVDETEIEDEQAHTPEPWKRLSGVILDGDKNPIARASCRPNMVEAVANAERIVACVNGCKGIADPSCVKELLDSCVTLKDLLTHFWDDSYSEESIAEGLQYIDAIIAKATGKE